MSLGVKRKRGFELVTPTSMAAVANVQLLRRRAKRPINKELISILHNVGTTQGTTFIIPPAVFPGTVTGLRWSVCVRASLVTGPAEIFWAIVVVPQGDTIDAMSIGDGTSFYAPEKNVLTFGIFEGPDADLGVGPVLHVFEGTTKTMRKFMVGDTLAFISNANNANAGRITAIIQVFYMT